jgi:hypothetical protein
MLKIWAHTFTILVFTTPLSWGAPANSKSDECKEYADGQFYSGNEDLENLTCDANFLRRLAGSKHCAYSKGKLKPTKVGTKLTKYTKGLEVCGSGQIKFKYRCIPSVPVTGVPWSDCGGMPTDEVLFQKESEFKGNFLNECDSVEFDTKSRTLRCSLTKENKRTDSKLVVPNGCSHIDLLTRGKLTCSKEWTRK